MKTLLGLCLVVLLTASFNVHSKNMAQANVQNVRIVLTDEACSLKEVTNLPYRATWTQDGKTIEGCVGAFGGGFLAFYFADKTVAIVPSRVFVPLTGA